jgi:LPXTG-motif cell wall-anchored protein
VDATATPADGAPAAAPQPTAAAAAAPAATAAPAPAKPKELPTTGETVPEVWTLVGVALALLAVGWRLRAGRA